MKNSVLGGFALKKPKIFKKSTFFALFNIKKGIVMHLSTKLSTIQNITVDKLFHKFYETETEKDKHYYNTTLCGMATKKYLFFYPRNGENT